MWNYWGPRHGYRHHRGYRGFGLPWMMFLGLPFSFMFFRQFWWILLLMMVVAWIASSIGRMVIGSGQQAWYQQQASPEKQQGYTTPYQAQQPQPQTYAAYEQGYQAEPESYQQNERSYRPGSETREEGPVSSYQGYEMPQAEYPQQMPPM
jgi:hypothetical protein